MFFVLIKILQLFSQIFF